MIDGRWLYGKLRICAHMKITVRVYNDWIRTNSSLVGFLCEVRGGLSKEEQLEKIKLFISNHELPVEMEDQPESEKQFKLKIIK